MALGRDSAREEKTRKQRPEIPISLCLFHIMCLQVGGINNGIQL